MDRKKVLLKNAAIMYTADLLGKVFSFLLIVIIARTLGDFGLGQYSFVFAFVGIFSILSDFGLSTYLVREIAVNKKLVARLGSAWGLKLALGIFASLIPMIAILLAGKSPQTITLVWVASLGLFFSNAGMMLKSLFQAHEQFEYYALYDLLERILGVIIGGSLLLMGYGLVPLVCILAFSSLISFGIGLRIVRKKYAKLRPRVHLKEWKHLMRQGLPFWLTAFFISIYFNIDTIMLTWMKDFTVVGWYGAASKIVKALYFVPFVLVAVIFPALSQLHRQSVDALRKLHHKTLSYLLYLALPIAVGGSLIADKLILSFYGGVFTPAILAFRILIWTVPLMFTNYAMGYVLNATHRQHYFTIATSISVLLNVILNAALIPYYAHVGASAATVATEFLNTLLLISFTVWFGYGFPWAKLWRPLLGCLGMAVGIIMMSSFSLWLMVPAAVIIYGLIMFGLGALENDEKSLLLSLIRQ